MKHDNIRIKASNPSLESKINVEINQPTDTVYWYIKFNIALDPESVSEKTMSVTDTMGYIMRTFITYNESRHMIVISPLDTYEQKRFYVLNISKKVRSAKGQELKHEIHILFKLLNDEIQEFEILKSNVKLPKPKPRPKDYDQKYTRSKVYSYDGKSLGTVSSDKLPFAGIRINPILGVLGIGILIWSLTRVPLSLDLMITALIICGVGLAHIVYQMTRREFRANMLYNRGVMQFNSGKYQKADKLFNKAHALDVNNELAEYAVNKVTFYK